MQETIINLFIAIIPAVITGFISYFRARSKARADLKSIKLKAEEDLKMLEKKMEHELKAMEKKREEDLEYYKGQLDADIKYDSESRINDLTFDFLNSMINSRNISGFDDLEKMVSEFENGGFPKKTQQDKAKEFLKNKRK